MSRWLKYAWCYKLKLLLQLAATMSHTSAICKYVGTDRLRLIITYLDRSQYIKI